MEAHGSKEAEKLLSPFEILPPQTQEVEWEESQWQCER